MTKSSINLLNDNLLTTKEAAAYLNLPRKTLEAWRQDNKYLRYTKIGKSVRYLKSDLAKFIEDGFPPVFKGEE